MEVLSENPGVNIRINDSILPVSQLIVCRVTGDRNIYKSLVELVRNCEPEEVWSWIDALQFPSGWDVDTQLRRLLRRHDFLDKHDADWLLEFI
tara:strand:+ start:335 stop:613 length:279 start_codon:yes stop_codon:yes gene_type:complete